MNIRDILEFAPVLPLLRVSTADDAVAAARALAKGGLRALEVAGPSTAALAGVEAIRKSVPECVVGVGGLTRAADFAAAGRVGAQFGTTPGWTAELATATRGARFPVLPGVMTPSEVIAARHAGVEVVRLYPARFAGGTGFLVELTAQFADLLFCAAGGIDRAAAREFLALANVISVGASWVAPPELVAAKDWLGIEARAREAASLRR
jgi:2-dehydro-3-deoxyphosphogluconate aldolase / (4S)-4-hydroxy-2-oxoglutarate aldolase